jgi:hypothetical protein
MPPKDPKGRKTEKGAAVITTNEVLIKPRPPKTHTPGMTNDEWAAIVTDGGVDRCRIIGAGAIRH